MTPGTAVAYTGDNEDLKGRDELIVLSYANDPEHGSLLVVVGGSDGPTWAVDPDLLEPRARHIASSGGES